MSELLELEDVLDFGKYEGSTVQEVLNDDHEYLAWMQENLVRKFSREVLSELKDAKFDAEEETEVQFDMYNN